MRITPTAMNGRGCLCCTLRQHFFCCCLRYWATLARYHGSTARSTFWPKHTWRTGQYLTDRAGALSEKYYTVDNMNVVGIPLLWFHSCMRVLDCWMFFFSVCETPGWMKPRELIVFQPTVTIRSIPTTYLRCWTVHTFFCEVCFLGAVCTSKLWWKSSFENTKLRVAFAAQHLFKSNSWQWRRRQDVRLWTVRSRVRCPTSFRQKKREKRGISHVFKSL